MEFASLASRKLRLLWADIRQALARVRAVCKVEPLTVEGREQVVAISERYGFSMYDSLIVCAALLSGCTALYPEDMQDGQFVEGQLTIRTPFAVEWVEASGGLP